MPNLQD